jgi:cellulose synthase operon protein YhjQ
MPPPTVERDPRQPYTVAVVSLTDGAGRTTVAANLASALSQEGRRSFAIDLNPANQLSSLFGMDPHQKLGLIYNGLTTDHLRAFGSGTICVPFGRSEHKWIGDFESFLEREPTWLFNKLISVSPIECDTWVIDVPVREGALMKQALALADLVIVVVTPKALESETARAWDALVQRTVRRAARGASVHYVLNRFDSRRTEDRMALSVWRGKLGAAFLPFTIQEDVAVSRSADHRSLLVQAAPESQVVADMNSIAEWVLSRKRGAQDPKSSR